MIFKFDYFFVLFSLFSFDVIIITPHRIFVNTFLYISCNYYLSYHLPNCYIVYFLYYILFSDNSIILRFYTIFPIPAILISPHANKQTGYLPYRTHKYS